MPVSKNPELSTESTATNCVVVDLIAHFKDRANYGARPDNKGANLELERSGDLPKLTLTDAQTDEPSPEEEWRLAVEKMDNKLDNVNARQRADFTQLMENGRGSYMDTLAHYLDTIDDPKSRGDGIISKQDIDKYLEQAKNGTFPKAFKNMFSPENVAMMQRFRRDWDTNEVMAFRDNAGRGDEIHLDEASKKFGFSGDRDKDAKQLTVRTSENVSYNRQGQVTSIKYAEGTTRFEYDATGQVTRMVETDHAGKQTVVRKGLDGTWAEVNEDGSARPRDMRNVSVLPDGKLQYSTTKGDRIERNSDGSYTLEAGTTKPDSIKNGKVRWIGATGDTTEATYENGKVVRVEHHNSNTGLNETFELRNGQWRRNTEFNGKTSSELLQDFGFNSSGDLGYRSADGTRTTQFSNGPREVTSFDGVRTLYRHGLSGKVEEITRTTPDGGSEVLQQIGNQWVLITTDAKGQRTRSNVKDVQIHEDGRYTYKTADRTVQRSPYEQG